MRSLPEDFVFGVVRGEMDLEEQDYMTWATSVEEGEENLWDQSYHFYPWEQEEEFSGSCVHLEESNSNYFLGLALSKPNNLR